MMTLYKNRYRFKSKESHDLCFRILLILEEIFVAPNCDTLLRLSVACNLLLHRLSQESDDIAILSDVTLHTISMLDGNERRLSCAVLEF